jgi:four helix bundle protein
MSQFDFEKLEVYRLALAFDVLVDVRVPRKGGRVLRDQIERSSLSVVASIAEGAGHRSLPDKRRCYARARGSAMESAALLEILRTRRMIPADAYSEGRALLLGVVRMLTRLCGPAEPEPPD